MNSNEFENRRLRLYHSLGANFDEEQYLWEYEQAFLAAESEFRSEEIKAYLNLISDPYILPDTRLKEWRKYFMARQAFMYRDFDQVEVLLASIQPTDEEDMRKLWPRIKLLSSQVQALRGDWVEAQKGFLSLIKKKDKYFPEYIRIETHLWLSRAALFTARSLGGWAELPDSRFSILMGWLFRLVLLPLYLPLIVYLWLKGCLVFWKAALWYAADYSNWHVFRNYTTAYHALSKINLGAEEDTTRLFRTRMLRAGLLADIGSFKLALREYDLVDEMAEVQFNSYRQALVVYGRANLLVLQGQDAAEGEMDPFIRAKNTLSSHRDEYSTTRMGLMLAALDLTNGRYATGLEKWKEAAIALSHIGDKGIIAEALEILYQVEPMLPDKERQDAASFSEQIQPKVFSARLPNLFFRFIQVLGTAAPLLLLLTIIVLLVLFVASSTRQDVRNMWQTVFSSSGLMTTAITLAGGMVLNTILGLIGLASVIFASPTSQEYYTLNEGGLPISTDTPPKTLAWTTIQSITVIDRGLFFSMDGSLSFCHLKRSGSGPVRLAGTTRQFARMVKEIEIQSGKSAKRLRLRWYGGLPFILAALGAALSFFLTDGIFSPWLDFSYQAKTAAYIMILAYLQLAGSLANWIAHFMNVAARTQSLARTASIGGGLGLVLAAAGVIGRDILYPAHLMFVLLGGSMVIHGLFLVKDTLKPPARYALATLTIPILLAGTALTAYTLFPTLYNIEAYAYSGEVTKMAAQPDADPALRQDYFTRMGASAHKMLSWDRSYTSAFGYLGNAEFFEENFSASLEAYTAGIEMGNITDLYYCRALAHARLKNESQAAEDYQAYLATHVPGRRLTCQILFQETSIDYPLP
jgi:hypothetical protein